MQLLFKDKKKLKETQGSLRLLKEVFGQSGRFFDSKSGNPGICSNFHFGGICFSGDFGDLALKGFFLHVAVIAKTPCAQNKTT